MGGLNAFRYCLERQLNIKGLIVESPAFGLDAPPNAVKIFFGSIASRIVPSLAVNNELDPKDISRLPEEVRRYKEDKMIHNKISLLTAKTMLDYQKWLQNTKEPLAINVPILLCHGSADRMTSPAASKVVFEKIACQDKEIKIYDGAYHSLHYDLCADQFKHDLVAWLSSKSMK